MKYLFALALFGAAAIQSGPEPEPVKREVWIGHIDVESNPWGGFGQKTFCLWAESPDGYCRVSEDMAFASMTEYHKADKYTDCRVEVIGFRVRRSLQSWIVVEGIRERTR